MSFRGHFAQVSQHYTNSTKRVSLVQSGHHHYLIENNLFTPQIVELALNNNHSLINVYLPKLAINVRLIMFHVASSWSMYCPLKYQNIGKWTGTRSVVILILWS